MLKNIDPSNPVPLYQQIKQSIIKAIQDGDWQVNEQIPTEIELGDYFQASRTTIRQAVAELISDKYLYRKRGVGTFVSDLSKQQDPHHDWLVHINTSDLIQSKNKAYSRKILKMEEVYANEDLSEFSGIKNGTRLFRLTRLQYEDGEPATYTVTYVFPEYAPSFMDDKGKILNGLHQYLKESGNEIVNVDYEISAFKATNKEIIDNLGIEPDSANIFIKIHSYNRDGELVEFSFTFFNSQKITIPVYYKYK